MDNLAHSHHDSPDLWSGCNDNLQMSSMSLQNYLSSSREHHFAPDVTKAPYPSPHTHPYLLLNYSQNVTYSNPYYPTEQFGGTEQWQAGEAKPSNPVFPVSKRIPIKLPRNKSLGCPANVSSKGIIVDQPCQQNNSSGLSSLANKVVDQLTKGDNASHTQHTHCHPGPSSIGSDQYFLTGVSKTRKRKKPAQTKRKETKKKKSEGKKKRMRNEDSWARNRRKRARDKGESYVNVIGKTVPARSVKPVDCSKCKFQCTTHITDEDRQDFFKMYWDLETFRDRVNFICDNVQEFVPLRPISGRRSFSRRYKVKVKDKEIRVCKEFFTTTFDISESTIVTSLNKKRQNPLIIQDLRGKRPPSNKTPDNALRNIREHILSQIGLQGNLDKPPDGETKSVKKLYSLYEAECIQDNLKPFSLCTYRKVFTDLHRGNSDRPISLPPDDILHQEIKTTSRRPPDSSSKSNVCVTSSSWKTTSSITMSAVVVPSSSTPDADCDCDCELSLSPIWDSAFDSFIPPASAIKSASTTASIPNNTDHFIDTCTRELTQTESIGTTTSAMSLPVSSKQLFRNTFLSQGKAAQNVTDFNYVQQPSNQHQDSDSFHLISPCHSDQISPTSGQLKENCHHAKEEYSCPSALSVDHSAQSLSEPFQNYSNSTKYFNSSCQKDNTSFKTPLSFPLDSLVKTISSISKLPSKVSCDHSSASHPITRPQPAEQSIQQTCNDQSSTQKKNKACRSSKKTAEAVPKERSRHGSAARKRTRNEELWARNVRKRLRFKGEEYISVRGKKVEAKRVKDVDCTTCKFKCPSKVTEEQRREINTHYWNLESYVDKVAFITKRVQTFKPKRKMTGRRAFSRKYTFEIDQQEVQVCKDFFQGTLNLGESSITTALEKSRKGPEALVDLRGKHKAVNKTPDNMLQNICDLIIYVTGLRRHRQGRGRSDHQDFDYRINHLYQVYKYDSQVKGQKVASLHVFRSVLLKEFGISGSTIGRNSKSKKN